VGGWVLRPLRSFCQQVYCLSERSASVRIGRSICSFLPPFVEGDPRGDTSPALSLSLCWEQVGRASEELTPGCGWTQRWGWESGRLGGLHLCVQYKWLVFLWKKLKSNWTKIIHKENDPIWRWYAPLACLYLHFHTRYKDCCLSELERSLSYLIKYNKSDIWTLGGMINLVFLNLASFGT
jgi:hypothetical protein